MLWIKVKDFVGCVGRRRNRNQATNPLTETFGRKRKASIEKSEKGNKKKSRLFFLVKLSASVFGHLLLKGWTGGQGGGSTLISCFLIQHMIN